MKKIKILNITTNGCFFVSYENLTFNKLQIFFKKNDGISSNLNKKIKKSKTDFEFYKIYKKKYIS